MSLVARLRSLVAPKLRRYQPTYEEAKLDYDAHVEAGARRRIAKYAAGPVSRCLDVGCGASTVIHELASGTGLCVGLDMDPFCVDVGKRLATDRQLNVDFARGDAARLPFRTGCFSAAYCSNVLEHLSNPEDCVQEIARVLANQGILVCAIPNRWGLPELLQDLVFRIVGKRGLHISRVGYSQLKRALRDSGFEIREVESGGSATGIVAYFIEDFASRFYAPRKDLWQIRRGYQRSKFFRLACTLEGRIAGRLPFLAAGWIITATKSLPTSPVEPDRSAEARPT